MGSTGSAAYLIYLRYSISNRKKRGVVQDDSTSASGHQKEVLKWKMADVVAIKDRMEANGEDQDKKDLCYFIKHQDDEEASLLRQLILNFELVIPMIFGTVASIITKRILNTNK